MKLYKKQIKHYKIKKKQEEWYKYKKYSKIFYIVQDNGNNNSKLNFKIKIKSGYVMYKYSLILF